ASDYEDIPQAILLRAMSEYSARIVAVHAFPLPGTQMQWVWECWKAACRIAGHCYVLTDRMAKLVIFLIRNSTYTYDLQDFDARTGYAGNSIIADVRQAMLFKDKSSLGAIYRSHFEPITLPNLALDFSVLEFCSQEWSTGTFVQAQFFEKNVYESYHIHLADIQKWSALNVTVVENIRRKWYTRAPNIRITATAEASTNIDLAQEDVLRNELAGRTGATDSEPESE
ncbi:hypothetical protein B0H10DRAFT_1725999, partial [Mycena sp. CBHHK59/15]